MSRPRGSGSTWRGKGRRRGALTVYLAVFLPVLIFFFLTLHDVGLMLAAKAQARAAATAAAAAAVGNQSPWIIPIPTEWIYVGVPIPIEGIIINSLRLPDVDGFGVGLRGTANTVLTKNGGQLFKVDVYPWKVAPAPFKYVTVTASVAPQGLLAKWIHPQPFTYQACGLAWVRPDYWVIDSWWAYPEKTTDLIKSVVSESEGDPIRYYRLIPCKDGLTAFASILEVVATEHYKVTGEKPDEKKKQVVLHKQEKIESEPDADKPRLPDASCKDRKCPKKVTCPDGKEFTVEPTRESYGSESEAMAKNGWTMASKEGELCKDHQKKSS